MIKVTPLLPQGIRQIGIGSLHMHDTIHSHAKTIQATDEAPAGVRDATYTTCGQCLSPSVVCATGQVLCTLQEALFVGICGCLIGDGGEGGSNPGVGFPPVNLYHQCDTSLIH